MRFFEVESSVDAIISAAMVAQARASKEDAVGRLSMSGFLQMLQNAGVVLDYEGFKSVFDKNPALKNVISKFDQDSITFVGDSNDKGSYEEPTTDMPDDERVAKMAKRAVRTRESEDMRAEEFVEDAGDLELLRPMINMKGTTLKRYGASIAKKYPHLAKSVKAMMPTEGSELPPHLAKMCGKDGRQVDTRTDVMRQMRDIVANKQAMSVKFADGKQMIDMYTASVLTQIYDKVNDNSKEAIIQRIGTKEKFAKLMPKLFGMLGEGHSPHKKGTAKYKKHMAAMHAGMNEAAPKMKYALVGSDNKIYAMGSDERDLRLDRRSLEQRFPDAAPLKMARVKTAQRIGDKVSSEQMKERELTKAEYEKKKEYLDKLPDADFKERYGKEWESVKYATATKMAKANA